MDIEHYDPVGIVHVDLSSLAFEDDIGSRELDQVLVDHLAQVFKAGCFPDEIENHIPAYMKPEELRLLLPASQLTSTDLQASLSGRPYPRLELGQDKLHCLHGRHRLQAAAIALQPGDCWWTIRLYSFELGPHSPSFFRRQVEQFFHQTKFSDGEVYRNMRFYKQQKDVVQDWMLRLSDGKQDDMSRLLKNEGLVKALDRLLPFPGLWEGFQLGNIRNLLALHCPEHTICNIEHIYTAWDDITLRNAAIRRCVDIETIRNLQRRAPSASTVDRHYIIREMDNKALFPAITDVVLREAIKQVLLACEIIIPSFKTFHDNVKCVRLIMKIVKNIILDNEPDTTIYKAMRSHWTAPESLLEDFREEEFRNVTLEETDVRAYFCYLTVCVAALQWFPYLSFDNPLQERKRKRDSDAGILRGSIDSAYEVRFLRLAQQHGFRTTKIIERLRNAGDLPEEIPTLSTEASYDESMNRRSGIPYTNAYKQLRAQLCLGNLRRIQERSDHNPSAMFVQRDFFKAFFGWAPRTRIDIEPSYTAAPSQPSAPPETSALPEPAAPPELAAPESDPALPSQAIVSPSDLFHRPVEIVNSPRVLVERPQSVSSEYTPREWPLPSPTAESLQGTAGHWSQFSLPAQGDSESEGERSGLEEQSEGNLTTLINERRSFPEPELGEDERRSSSINAPHNTGINCPISTERTDRRSFPATILQDTDLPWLDSIHESGRQPPSFLDWEISDERRSFPTTETNILSPTSNDCLERRSFPQPESVGPDQNFDGEIGQCSTAGNQLAPTGNFAERRSFPALEPPGQELREGRRSFPASDVEPNVLESLSRLTNREAIVGRDRQVVFAFEEYNGMTKKKKLTLNMERYLEEREGWTMMVLKHDVLKTIRFDHIVDHMRSPDEAGRRKYFLINRHYAEKFRTRYKDRLRPA